MNPKSLCAGINSSYNSNKIKMLKLSAHILQHRRIEVNTAVACTYVAKISKILLTVSCLKFWCGRGVIIHYLLLLKTRVALIPDYTDT